MCLYSRMHDTKEGRSYQSGSGGRCHCGECIQFGCPCADSGSHSGCLCDRCGDGSDDDWQGRKGSYE